MPHQAPTYPLAHPTPYPPPSKPTAWVTKEGFLGLTSMVILTLALPAVFFGLLMLLVGGRSDQTIALGMVLASGLGSLVGAGLMRASSKLSYEKKMLESQAPQTPMFLTTYPLAPPTPQPQVPTLDELARQHHGVLTPAILANHVPMTLAAAQAHLDALVQNGVARRDLNPYGVPLYALLERPPKARHVAPQPNLKSMAPGTDGTDGSVF